MKFIHIDLDSKKYLYQIVFLFALALYSFLGLFHYLGAGRDDVFMTLWEGENLSKGLVNYNYENVEICSSLFHVLVVGAISLFTKNVFIVNKLVGFLTSLIVFLVLFVYRDRLIVLNKFKLLAFCFINIILATSPSFLYWNSAGLETPYQTVVLFLYGVFLLEYWRRPTGKYGSWLIILQCLYMLIRPEGFYLILFTVILILFDFQNNGVKWSKLALFAIPFLFFILITLSRYILLDSFFPNPVYAKAKSLGTGISFGSIYLWNYYTSSGFALFQLFIILPLTVYYFRMIFSGIVSKKHTFRKDFDCFIIFGLTATINLVVILIGGDWMEYFRFVVPVIPFLVILSTVFFIKFIIFIQNNVIKHWYRSGYWVGGLLFAIFLILIIANHSQNGTNKVFQTWGVDSAAMRYSMKSIISDFSLNHFESEIMRANQAHLRDLENIKPFIDNELLDLYRKKGKLVIVTSQVGFFPYYTRKKYPHLNLYFVDINGLTDKTIARMKIPKTPIGVSPAGIVQVITGQSGIISDYVDSLKPNMLYILRGSISKKQKLLLKKGGWNIIWEKPICKIFYREDIV